MPRSSARSTSRDEPVHRAAVTELGLTANPADAAVVLVLKRLDDARRDGDRVIALIDAEPAENQADPRPPNAFPVDLSDLSDLFGAPHAARGLLNVAAAALALRHRARPIAGQRAQPRLAATTADVVTAVLGAPPAHVRLRAADADPWTAGPVPRLHIYSGATRSDVLAAVCLRPRERRRPGPPRRPRPRPRAPGRPTRRRARLARRRRAASTRRGLPRDPDQR